MQRNHEGFLQLLYAIIVLQFGLITVLLAGFSSEYLSNVFFRAWVDINFPWLGPLLQGQMDSLLVGVAFGVTLILIQRFRVELKAGKVDSPKLPTLLNVDEQRQTLSKVPRRAVARDPSDSPEQVMAELERQEAI